MKKLLWLDDVRDPFNHDINWLIFSPIGRNVDIHWVKSYSEFTSWILNNGLPDGICFDHDLGDESDNEKTGLDCAKFLINICIDQKLSLPLYSSQSANPVGRDNILKLLDNFKKLQNNE